MDAPDRPPTPPPLPPPQAKLSLAATDNTLPDHVIAAVQSAVQSGVNKVVSAAATSAVDLARHPKVVETVGSYLPSLDDNFLDSAHRRDLRFLENRNAVLSGVKTSSYSDYVIEFRFATTPTATFLKANKDTLPDPKDLSRGAREKRGLLYEEYVEKSFTFIVARLKLAGLDVETRQVETGRLFLFVTCPSKRINQEALKSRVNDFLYGVRGAHLNFGSGEGDEVDADDILAHPLTTSERLRLVHGIITGDVRQGGAHIVERGSEFTHAVFPLHDMKLNKTWITDWSMKWSLNQDDLNLMRDQFGEQVAYYFSFLQNYFLWLIFPSVVGIMFYITGNYFSMVHGIFNLIWSTLFVAFWRRRERELAILWDVRETSRVDHPRAGFRPQSEIIDPVTKERILYFPTWKRYLRIACTLPLLGCIGILLMALVGAIFSFEIFMTEFYHGPGLAILIYSPTVIYSALVPVASSMYFKFARSLNKFENHETERQDEAWFSQKIFFFNFMVSFLSVFLTAYVYIPFSGDFEHWLRKDAQIETKHTMIGRDRIVGQLIYFVLTGQAINFGTEVIVPFFSRVAQRKIRAVAKAHTRKKEHERRDSSSSTGSAVESDDVERKFLRKVRHEADKPDYDMYEDFAEMVTQFGYVSLFSIGWPLIPLVCLVNNWLELRSDAVKICVHARRPVPRRTDTIGPWLDNLDRLTILASVTNVTLSLMYADNAPRTNPLPSFAHLLLATLIAENVYFILKRTIDKAIERLPSATDAIIRKNDYELKKKYMPNFGRLPRSVSAESVRSARSSGSKGINESEELLAGLNEIRSAFKKE